MNSKNLLENLEKIVEILDSQEIVMLIEESERIYQEYNKALIRFLKEPSNTTQLKRDVDRIFERQSQYIEQISAKAIFYCIRDQEKQLYILDGLQEETKKITDILSKLSISFEKCIRSPRDTAEFVEFLEAAKQYGEIYQKYISILNLTKLSLLSTLNTNKENTLSIYLEYSNSFPNIIFKLNSIKELYSILCEVLKINESAEPINVLKIESGSLWTFIFGNTEIIKILNSWMESAVFYFHRSFTKEGKINSIPKTIESLNIILDFTKKLEEAGLKTNEARDYLNKAAVKVASNLNKLLSDEPVVEINSKKYDIGIDLHKKYLEENKLLMIEDSSDEG